MMFRKLGFVLSLMLAATFGYAQGDPDGLTVDSLALAAQVEEVVEAEALVPFEITKDIFHNLVGKGKPEAAKISWSIDYAAYPQLTGKELIIRYATAVDAKRIKKDVEGAGWLYTEPFDVSKLNMAIENLNGNEKYEFYLGLSKSGAIDGVKEDKEQMVWSEKIKAKTERGMGVFKLLIMIGALGLFIFGMKIMSDGLQRAAGTGLRRMLGSITKNRVAGVITGFSSTAIVQSSSVTTVMTVSLVNAGLLNLRQSAGVMMGANIGTTITAWLVLLLGFKVSISSYALMMIALAAPLLFLTFRKSKDIANGIIGFAILFIGLQFLKDAVPDMDENSPLIQFFRNYKDIPVISNLMFVALGTLVTVIIQSSSAAMALTLTMVSQNIIPFEVACAMVLGENIGTTITAQLASFIGNVHAKRAAAFHSLFNVFGVVWMLLVFPLFLSLVGWILHRGSWDPTNPVMAGEGIAMFHTLFNVANVVILIWFLPFMVKLAERSVKSKGDADEEFKLDYITAGIVDVPEVAILEAQKEVAKFGKITARMSEFMRILLNDQDKKTRMKMFKKMQKYEEITDRVEVEIAQYLEKMSTNELTASTSTKIRSMLSITNDLERIGDIFFQMSKTIERKDDQKIYFLPDQRENLNGMLDLVDKAFSVMNDNLDAGYGHITSQKALEAEREINGMRNILRKSYLENVQTGEYNITGGMMYNDIFSSCEKVGDHIINVSEAVEGQI
jgi:phosphate:Na+ symporter